METRATRPFETANRSQHGMYVRVCMCISAVPQVESDRTRFTPRCLGTASFRFFFYFFFFSFFLVQHALPYPPSLPPLTNAYREYVGNFDAHRSPRCRHSRCCENPIEVGTRHEDISKIFVDGATRSAKNTKNVPFHSLRQFRSFVRSFALIDVYLRR